MVKCPESIEEVDALEQRLPLCRKEILEQVEARKKAGTAKSDREAARQLAEEMGKKPETVRKAAQREKKQSGDSVPKDKPKGDGGELPLCTECREAEVYVHPKTGKPVSRKSVSYGLCGVCKESQWGARKWERELAEGIERRMGFLNGELRRARPHLGENGLTKHRDCFHEALVLRDTLLEMFPLEDEANTTPLVMVG